MRYAQNLKIGKSNHLKFWDKTILFSFEWLEQVSECCLTPYEQFFSHIMELDFDQVMPLDFCCIFFFL